MPPSSTSRCHPPSRYHHHCTHLEPPWTINPIHVHRELGNHRESSIFFFIVRETESCDATQRLHPCTYARITFFLATSAMETIEPATASSSRNQICVFFIIATLTAVRNTKPSCLIPLMVAPPSTCSNKTFSQPSIKLTNVDLSPFFRNSRGPITSIISRTLICSHEHHYCHYNACLALSAPQQ